jgi:hypothetical protein
MRGDPYTAHTILPTLLQDGDNTAVVLLAETFNDTLKMVGYMNYFENVFIIIRVSDN